MRPAFSPGPQVARIHIRGGRRPGPDSGSAVARAAAPSRVSARATARCRGRTTANRHFAKVAGIRKHPPRTGLLAIAWTGRWAQNQAGNVTTRWRQPRSVASGPCTSSRSLPPSRRWWVHGLAFDTQIKGCPFLGARSRSCPTPVAAAPVASGRDHQPEWRTRRATREHWRAAGAPVTRPDGSGLPWARRPMAATVRPRLRAPGWSRSPARP